jgi:CHAT domain-containing protein
VWLDVAGGTLSPEETTKYVQHAADCPSCGPKLQAATQLFQDELTPEEEKALAALPSAVPTAQRKLAEKLAGTTVRQPQPIVIKPQRRFWRPLYVGFATAAVLVFAVFLSLGPITDSLLAHGYKERGTLELRIAKAEPPKEGTRGADIEEKEQPASLVVADLLIRTRLALNSKNARWLGEKGRLELIEGKSSAALEDLSRAHSLNPQSKVITIDLASAMIVHYSGHQEQPTELFQAQEELLKLLPRDSTDSAELRRDPDNLLAVYNLAVIYELMGSFPQAIQEWELYLKLDSGSTWAEESRKRLQNLRNRKQGNAPPRPSAPVSEWRKYLDSAEPNASEAALDVAVAEWLSRDSSKPADLRSFLRHLSATLSKEHGDTWLFFALETPPSFQMDKGFEALKYAIEDNARGDFDNAVREASRAQSIFHRARNKAGLVRAQLEQVYSYQRATRGESCLDSAHLLENALTYSDFPWIRVQLYLDKAGCFNVLGRLQEAKLAADRGLALAERSGYRILALRATGIRASQATTRGDPDVALRNDIEGLRKSQTWWYPPERAYQFYSDITFNAEAQGEWHVAYVVGEEAALEISQTPHKDLEALTRYRVSKAAVMCGDLNGAAEEARKADGLFASLPRNEAMAGYKLDGIVGLARAENDSGQSTRAVSLLEKYGSDLPPLESRLLLRRLYQLKGDIALKQGQLADANNKYGAAVQMAESALTTLVTPRDRLIWNRENAPAYRSLAQVMIQQEKPVEAFHLWEAYKAAAARRISRAAYDPSSSFNASLSHDLGSVIEASSLAPDQGLISYAFLPGGPFAWFIHASGIVSSTLSVTTIDLRKQARRFIAECENSSSDLSTLRLHANLLYNLLLGPFQHYLTGIHRLTIESDGELDDIPFEALVTNSGEYVIENLSIVYSPGISFAASLRQLQPVTASDRALVVGISRVSSYWEQVLGAIPSAEAEAQGVASRLPHSILLTDSDASKPRISEILGDVSVFHFAGHSIDTNNGMSLVLAGNEKSSSPDDSLFTMTDLDQAQLVKLKLVVLSACSTGTKALRSPEPFYLGLLLARIPQIVVTRWPVDSKYTGSYMRNLYANLLEGMTTAEGMRQAGNLLRRDTLTAHPFYWAPFFLVGRI